MNYLWSVSLQVTLNKWWASFSYLIVKTILWESDSELFCTFTLSDSGFFYIEQEQIAIYMHGRVQEKRERWSELFFAFQSLIQKPTEITLKYFSVGKWTSVLPRICTISINYCTIFFSAVVQKKRKPGKRCM